MSSRETAAVVEGGTVWVLRMLEVADQVDLEKARIRCERLGARRGESRIRGPEKGPPGVLLATPPLDVDMGPVVIDELTFRASVRVYDFGTASVRLALAIAPGTRCADLIVLSARLERLDSIDDAAVRIWTDLAAQIAPAIRDARSVDLIEDYVLFEITSVRGCSDGPSALAALDPARLLLAEPDRELAPNVVESHLGRALHYYADDAAVIGWNAALALDPDGSRDELEVLEVATARRLELRYYDRLLARELESVYQSVARARAATGLFRSPFERVSRRAAQLFVEMTDLYDRVEGAITLVGDSYSARLYREAEVRFRLEAYSDAVKEKLGTLARVADVFQAEISHRRALVLEVGVLAVIIVEVILSVARR